MAADTFTPAAVPRAQHPSLVHSSALVDDEAVG
jgi:hypothetical protein